MGETAIPRDARRQPPALCTAIVRLCTILDREGSGRLSEEPAALAGNLKRLEDLWIEVVIGETDPGVALEAIEYAQQVIARYPNAAAGYISECVHTFSVPARALDILAQTGRFIETADDAFRVQRAHTRALQAILGRKHPGLEFRDPSPTVATAPNAAPPEKSHEVQPLLTEGHRMALTKLVEMGSVFFEQPRTESKVALRLFPLVVAPTGAGKSFLLRKAAADLGAYYFKITRGDWCPRGAKAGRPTTFQILDQLLKSDRLCLHLDELCKWTLDFGQEWSAAIGTDLWNVLDGHFQVEDYLRETKFGDKPAPSAEEVQKKIRTRLWIAGSGTWQSVFAHGQKVASLGFSPPPAGTHMSMTMLEKSHAISPELLLRFNSDPIFLSYPSEQETPDLLRSAGITALAEELGVTISPTEVDWQRGGMRVLETLATRLAIEKYRRSRKSPHPQMKNPAALQGRRLPGSSG